MTCQEYVDLIDDDRDFIDGITAAERAAVVRHMADCKSCRDWTHTMARKAIAEMSQGQLDRAKERVDRIVARDRMDPEVLRVVD